MSRSWNLQQLDRQAGVYATAKTADTVRTDSYLVQAQHAANAADQLRAQLRALGAVQVAADTFVFDVRDDQPPHTGSALHRQLLEVFGPDEVRTSTSPPATDPEPFDVITPEHAARIAVQQLQSSGSPHVRPNN